MIQCWRISCTRVGIYKMCTGFRTVTGKLCIVNVCENSVRASPTWLGVLLLLSNVGSTPAALVLSIPLSTIFDFTN